MSFIYECIFSTQIKTSSKREGALLVGAGSKAGKRESGRTCPSMMAVGLTDGLTQPPVVYGSGFMVV